MQIAREWRFLENEGVKKTGRRGFPRRPDLICRRSVYLAVTLVTATRRPTGTALGARLGLADADATAIHLTAIERLDGALCGIITFEGDETEALTATRLAVHHDHRIGDVATGLEVSTKLVIANCPGKTPDKNSITHLLPHLSRSPDRNRGKQPGSIWLLYGLKSRLMPDGTQNAPDHKMTQCHPWSGR